MMTTQKKECLTRLQKSPNDSDADIMRKKCDYSLECKEDANSFLSYDALATLFMILPMPERIYIKEVCPQWNSACQRAWYDNEKDTCGKTISRNCENWWLTQSHVEKVLKFGFYLKELSLSKVCDSSIMPVIGTYCKNLTMLEFVFDGMSRDIDTNVYVKELSNLKKLVSLKIQVITMNDNNSRNFPIEIINCLPEKMVEIHLFFDDSSLEEEPLLINLNKFKDLHSLTLGSCNLDKTIQDLSEKIKLVYLDIRESWVINESWENKFKKLINLEHIYLPTTDSHSKQLTTDDIVNIFNASENLKYFDKNFEYDIDSTSTSTSFNLIQPQFLSINWMNFENLVYLHACWLITNDFAINMVKYCKNLKYLIIDNGFDPAIKILSELENLEYLELLNILYFTKETIIAISNNCKKLKHLKMPFAKIVVHYFSGTYVYSEDQICLPSVLEELSKLQYLEYLNLNMFRNLQDNTIIAIANNCKYLKHLDIGFSTNCITETALNALTKLKQLEKLDVTDNKNLSDDIIVKLKGLKSLNVQLCSMLTDAGIIQLIKNCPDLENINLSYIENITFDTIIAADNATKNRLNGVILHIYTDDEKLFTHSEYKIKSQWLVIHKEFYKGIL